MTQQLEAIYEGGVFHPLEPVQLALLDPNDEAHARVVTASKDLGPVWIVITDEWMATLIWLASGANPFG